MDALTQLTAALTGRYDVLREIGRGGMATVYLARDTRHDRPLAVKVFDPELGALLGATRFLAEIRVTANLQHPNLLPLFDSGEAGGLLYYVMPFVSGESLRQRLEREIQLPVEEAVNLAITLAGALDYAHAHGVIHRDLKPENILLHAGQPLISDFGIALAVSNAGGERITQSGLSVGTPQYMSPEQATNDRIIDCRTDIYSLGAVLYEMLTGEPPHSGPTIQSVVAKVLTDKPRPLRLTREFTPAHVEAAVEKALAKVPADRFARASDFARALHDSGTLPNPVRERTLEPAGRDTGRRHLTWIAGVAFAVMTGLAAWGWFRPSAPTAPDPIHLSLNLPAEQEIQTGGPQPLSISPDGRVVAFIGGPNAELLFATLATRSHDASSGQREQRDTHFLPTANGSDSSRAEK